MSSLLPLIPALPLIGFAINGIFGRRLSKNLSGAIGSIAVLGSFILSVMCFSAVAGGESVRSDVFTWLNAGGWDIKFTLLADHLSAWMMLVITGVGFLIHVYSVGYMHDDEGLYKFFAYLNLFVFSMLLLVMGGNFMILFFGWEGVGLCSYLLIGFWYTNVEYGKAARKAFIMNRIGDLGLLLGIFLLFANLGTTDYATVFSAESIAKLDHSTITAICLLLFVGAIGKSAQLPLYTWLPDAMAGPTPVSALIHAATMVTAGIYMIVRSNALYSLSPTALSVVAAVGLATSLFAALIGLRQNDIKKILAYSTVSQLGLMFLALGVGAYSSAMFHLTTHAFFKALLFLGAGAVIHALGGEQDIRKMGGLRKEIPVIYYVMLAGTLAIIGFPMLSGYFSKDEILAKVYESHGIVWWGLTSISAMITGVYMCRMFFVTFHGTYRGHHHAHKSPAVMSVPLIILAVLSVVGGLLNSPHFMHLPNAQWMGEWFGHIIGGEAHGDGAAVHHLDESTELSLMLVTTTIALVILALCWWVYGQVKNLPVSDEEQTGLTKVLAKKFYVDELYDFLFVRPTEWLSGFLHRIVDTKGIDGSVNGVGKTVLAFSNQLRKVQNGNIEYYLLYMVFGAILLIASLLLL